MDSRLLSHLLAAVVALALAVGLAACGGSDDDDDANGGGTPAAEQEDRGGGDGADGEGRADRDGGPGGGGQGAGQGRGGGQQGGGGQGGGQGGGGGPSFSGDREEARAGAESVDDVYSDMRQAVQSGVASADVPVGNTLESAEDNDALGELCDLMSEQAKRETVTYARRSAGLADVDWSCEKAVGLLLRRSQQSGGLKRSLKAEVVGVNAVGDRATATVRFGKGPLSTVPMVKEDGEWKLGSAPAGGGGQ